MIDSLINNLLIILFGITLILFYVLGVYFWYVCFPLFIIIQYVKAFNKTQDKYKYDLRFWIESLDMSDFILIISYVISIGLYFFSYKLHKICSYINIGSFVFYILNYSIKATYFTNKSKSALPYVDFNESKKFITNKINDIIKYELHPTDIERLSELIYNDITVHSFEEDDDIKGSVYRLTYCKFAVKKIINDDLYVLSINEQLLPYLKNKKEIKGLL